MVCDRKEIHPGRLCLRVKLLRVRVAVRKIEAAEEPFFRAITVSGMQMKVATAHFI
jgi:hypothetical protein